MLEVGFIPNGYIKLVDINLLQPLHQPLYAAQVPTDWHNDWLASVPKWSCTAVPEAPQKEREDTKKL